MKEAEQAQESGRWVKPLADWRRIFEETPDYDCWPAPIRGWEVGALVERIGHLEAELTALRNELATVKVERDAAQARAVTNQEALSRLWADCREADDRAAKAEGLAALAHFAREYERNWRGFSNEDDDFWEEFEARYDGKPLEDEPKHTGLHEAGFLSPGCPACDALTSPIATVPSEENNG